MKSKLSLASLALAGGIALQVASGAALACAFHGYTPNPTLVDVLLETEQIVVARPDPGNPRRYAPAQTLLGPEVTEINLDVSAQMRSIVKRSPAATVLLARDGSYGPWREVAVMDTGFRGVVDLVVQNQSRWSLGAEGARLAFFANRVNDPHPAVRRLALQELDRVSYAALRGARLPPVRNLRQDLTAGDEDLLPIRVLLAGLSKDPSLSPFLSAELDKAAARGVPYLGAYATALIELDGPPAVDAIVARHLLPQTLPFATRQKLLEALAIHYRSAPRATRRTIARAVADLSRQSPDIAALAAIQFGTSDRWNPSSQSQGQRSTVTR